MNGFSLKHLLLALIIQKNLPWSGPYTSAFEGSQAQEGHRHLVHAIIHVVKATGVLAARAEEFDHLPLAVPPSVSAERRADFAKKVADVLISAVRIADVVGIDVQAEVLERLCEKNPGWEMPAEEGRK